MEGNSHHRTSIQQVACDDKVTRGGGASHNPCLAARKSSWNGLLRAGFLHSASHFDRIQFVPPFNMFAVSVLRCYSVYKNQCACCTCIVILYFCITYLSLMTPTPVICFSCFKSYNEQEACKISSLHIQFKYTGMRGLIDFFL